MNVDSMVVLRCVPSRETFSNLRYIPNRRFGKMCGNWTEYLLRKGIMSLSILFFFLLLFIYLFIIFVYVVFYFYFSFIFITFLQSVPSLSVIMTLIF